MSYEKRREELIAYAVNLIEDDVALPVDVLAELDQYGVNINWLFTEAASKYAPAESTENDYLIQGALV